MNSSQPHHFPPQHRPSSYPYSIQHAQQSGYSMGINGPLPHQPGPSRPPQPQLYPIMTNFSPYTGNTQRNATQTRPDSSHSTTSVPSLSHGPSPLPEEVAELENGVILVPTYHTSEPTRTFPDYGRPVPRSRIPEPDEEEDDADLSKDTMEGDEEWDDEDGSNAK